MKRIKIKKNPVLEVNIEPKPKKTVEIISHVKMPIKIWSDSKGSKK